jgi:glycosyltransferase involved in cell wall biosynthesis
MGRITVDKGIVPLLQAYSLSSQLNSSVKLLLVGSIEDSVFNYLATSAPSGVYYLPYTNAPHLVYPAADLLIMASKREGFGSAVIEAASCGVPALGTCIPGLVDSIDHLNSGFLLPSADPHLISRTIDFFVDHPDLLLALGSSARTRVKKLFSSAYVQHCLVQHILQTSSNESTI